MAFGFLKKLWSGSDFWDKDENKSQRDSFAKQDEEERRRKEAARRASQQSFRSNSSFNGPTNDFFEKNSREQEGQKIDLSKKLTKVASQGGYQLENAKVANDAEKERTANDAEKAKWEKTLDQSLWDKVKDTVDPNTNADKLRRVKAGKEIDYKGPGGVVGGVKKYGSVPLRSTARVGTGMAQGATGLYDLASPGTGTSQLSKNLDENAKALDRGAEQAGVKRLNQGANILGE